MVEVWLGLGTETTISQNKLLASATNTHVFMVMRTGWKPITAQLAFFSFVSDQTPLGWLV